MSGSSLNLKSEAECRFWAFGTTETPGATVETELEEAEVTGRGRMRPLALGSAVNLEVGMVIAITPTVYRKSDLLRKGNFPNPGESFAY